MEDVTLPPRQCLRCRGTLAVHAADGFCAACLFSAGIETLTGGAADDAPTML
jgi:hypothetical protein